MKALVLVMVLALFAAGLVQAQPAKPPQTVFKVLYIDQPFTEEESISIEKGLKSSTVLLRFLTASPDGKDKPAEVEFPITRNQISSQQTYFGREPIALKLPAQGTAVVATVPVPQKGGDLLIVLKPREPGLLDGASSLIVACGGADFSPGNLCIVNVTGFRLAFQTPQNSLILSPDEQHVFVPVKVMDDAFPLSIFVDTKPKPRRVFEGVMRLSDKDRIMFIAFSPPGSTDVFKTDFFMLQPTIPPASP